MKLVQKIAIAYIRTRLSILSAFSKRKAAAQAFELFCTPAKQPRIPLSPLFLEAEPLSLTIEGITLAGFRWNKDGGRRLQIVHGFESASQKFEIYIQAFIQKGYEVLVFDAPAHGLSGGKQITLPLYIDTLREVYRQYGPVQSFFAHSFGGLALVHFLETLAPDASVRLALVAPATETSTAIDGLFKLLHLGTAVRKEFDAIVRRKSNAGPGYYSISRAIDHIKFPVLWIHDRRDTTTPLADVQPIINKNNPQLRFLITDGFGHRRIYREESVVNAVTDFL